MKSDGKRSRFRRTARLSVFVTTPYISARSLSSITFSPRIKKIRRSTRSTSAAERAFASLVMVRLACLGTVNRRSTSMPLPALALLVCASVTHGDGRWSAAAPLPEPRGASGVGVVSGKLVVVGGWGVGRRLVDSTAIYDPATNRWRNAAPIPTPRDHLTAVAVSGTLYAIGGRPLNPDRNYDVVEAYDPATDRWTAKSRMPSRRGGLASTVLAGRVHTFGGETRSSVFSNHEVYDPATDRWTTAPSLPTARHGLGAATVGGRIYVIGGGPRPGLAQTDAVEVFTP